MDELKHKLEKYLKMAEPMFRDLTVKESGIEGEKARHFHDMAAGYYSDALHFYDRGQYINALAALEYAEGWLDAGKTIGIF